MKTYCTAFCLLFSLALLCCFSQPLVVVAQACGGGYVQEGGSGIISCVPIYPPATQDVQNVGPQWATRWGAIAFDPTAGRFGGAEGLDSERRAKKAAIKECRRNGGKNCKVIGQHRNQCGALASGKNYTVAWGAPEKSKAIESAVAACSEKANNCQAYYAGCSYAERVQ